MNSFRLIFKYLKNDKFKLFIYIVLIFMSYLPTIIMPYFWGKALELLILKNLNGFFYYLLIYFLMYLVLYGLLQIPRDNLYNYLEIKFTKNASKDLYQKLDKLPAIAFEEIGTGEFVNRIYNDPDQIMELLSKLVRMICKIIVALIVLILSFKIHFILGIEIVIFGIIMGVMANVFFPKIKKIQENIKKKSDDYFKSATENINGIREIKSLGIKNNIEKIMFKTIDDLFFHQRKMRKYEILYEGMNNSIYYVLQFIILLTAGYFVIKGNIAYSTLIIVEMYIWRIDEVVETIGDFGVNYNKVTVSLKRIDEIINNRLYQDEKFGHENIISAKGIIEFKNVSFRYRNDEENTLKNLNLKLEPNKKIAIVGKSGNGKSTIFNLLLRYFDVTEGEILIDNINIKDLTEESLRNNISIIRQSPFIFNMSILDNLKLVKEDISLDEVRKVCKRAYIDEYIMSLPNKYDTIIGEGGINLSGGQKQRLAIARTLLLNTKIILFDEATSALDNESQEYIKKTIDDLVKDHTIIIVAHRLSTIVDADVINVIDKGSLAAKGTHKELLEKSLIYKKLYKTEL